MAAVAQLKVRRIAGALGAEVTGVDLSRPLAAGEAAALRAAWLEHQVLFFRDQALTPAQYMTLARAFGKPIEYPFVQGIEGYPEIIEVKKLEHETVITSYSIHYTKLYEDLRPWLPLIEAREQARPSADDPLDAIRSVQSKADIEIGLKVEKLIWPQREAQGVSATLNVGADAVAARGAAQLLVGAIEGNARLETAQAEARLRVDAQADQIVLEALHPEVERAGVSGMA